MTFEEKEEEKKEKGPIFAYGLGPGTLIASLSRTSQTANNPRRRKNLSKIFLDFTYL